MRRREIEKLLADMGDTPAKVEACLRKAKCKGVPMSPHQCVVANHLRKKGVDVVSVGLHSGVTVRHLQPPIALPDAVIDIVAKFDHWALPDLVSADSRR